MRTLPRLLALTLGLALPLACDKSDADGEAAPKTEYTCTIIVAAQAGEPETFKGNFQGPDAQEAEDKAWEAVCAELPESDRADCKDSSKFAAATGTMEATLDDAPTYSTTITLTRVVAPEEFEAEVTGTESEDATCAEALAKACAAAGAEGDCVAAGTHERRGRKLSKKG